MHYERFPFEPAITTDNLFRPFTVCNAYHHRRISYYQQNQKANKFTRSEVSPPPFIWAYQTPQISPY